MNSSEFQRWATLAQRSPTEFEARRRQALLDAAASMPAKHQPMIRTLVDALCAPCCGTPIERVLHSQMLMSESLDAMHGAWAGLAATLVVDRIRQDAPMGRGPAAG